MGTVENAALVGFVLLGFACFNFEDFGCVASANGGNERGEFIGVMRPLLSNLAVRLRYVRHPLSLMGGVD